MTNEITLENLKLNSCGKNQIFKILNLIKKIFKQDLLGVYLYGSSILGGLQKYSDLDLFVILNRATTDEEKTKLVKSLLQISGIYMKSKKRPIEMTIVVKSEINPWFYPPKFDFQYGEWLREDFKKGNVKPWSTQFMPDLAILITQILLASNALMGVSSNQLLCPVPYKDFITATADSLSYLMTDFDSDIRNVLLTLGRIWATVETDTICSKPAAAEWVNHRLPDEYRAVMKRAKAICKGEEKEYWDDIQQFVKPCAYYMLDQVNSKITKIISSNDLNKSIKIA